jgi:hypothetical protein
MGKQKLKREAQAIHEFYQHSAAYKSASVLAAELKWASFLVEDDLRNEPF